MRVLKGGAVYFAEHRVLKILTFDMVSISSFVFLIIWSYQMLLKEVHVDIIYFGIIHALMCLAQILVQQTLNRLDKSLSHRKRVLVSTAVISGVGFVGLGLAQSVWLVILLIVVIAGFGLSRIPLYIGYMNNLIPSDKRATVLSVTSMARNIGIGLANIAAAAMSEWSLRYMMIANGLVILAFAISTRVKSEHLSD